MRTLHSFQGSANAVRERYRADGAQGVREHLLQRARAQLYETERHIVCTKDLDEIAVPRRRGRLTLEAIGSSHLPTLSELNRERSDLTGDGRMAGDLADGYQGWVALRDGEVVGFYWWMDATAKPHREWSAVALGVRLAPDEAYGTDFYVAPSARGGGTASEFLYQVETAFHERGVRRLWGTVAEDNQRARWLYDARGYRMMWAVDGYRILRHWYFRMAPLST
jgi:ribosomal protein S18 acetylase RimI-like enzyme